MSPGANPPTEAVGAGLVPSVPPSLGMLPQSIYFPAVSLALGSALLMEMELCSYRCWDLCPSVQAALLPLPNPSGNFLLLCNSNNSIVGLCFIPESGPTPGPLPAPALLTFICLSFRFKWDNLTRFLLFSYCPQKLFSFSSLPFLFFFFSW